MLGLERLHCIVCGRDVYCLQMCVCVHLCTSFCVVFSQSISQDCVSRIWSESGLDWTTHLRVEPEDVKYLVEDHVSGLH